MESNEFYERLKPEDARAVSEVAKALKVFGFDVYATGSSLQRKDYNDVDLVAVPASRSVVGSELNLARAVELANSSPENKGRPYSEYPQEQGPPFYSLSGVESRHMIHSSESVTLDVVVTTKPFELNPNAERVQL